MSWTKACLAKSRKNILNVSQGTPSPSTAGDTALAMHKRSYLYSSSHQSQKHFQCNNVSLLYCLVTLGNKACLNNIWRTQKQKLESGNTNSGRALHRLQESATQLTISPNCHFTSPIKSSSTVNSCWTSPVTCGRIKSGGKPNMQHP